MAGGLRVFPASAHAGTSAHETSQRFGWKKIAGNAGAFGFVRLEPQMRVRSLG
jgi:hypothetical protein